MTSLNKTILCGTGFKKAMTSPFRKVIVLGYYDGETSGLVKCANCPTSYRFELVAWDNQQENRIFSLAVIDPLVFESITQELARGGEPRWPVWVPRRLESEVGEEKSRNALARLLNKAAIPKLVVATDNIAKEITMCREIEPEARGQLLPPGQLPDPKSWSFWKEYLSKS
jgi:hypothetical protein